MHIDLCFKSANCVFDLSVASENEEIKYYPLSSITHVLVLFVCLFILRAKP